MMKKRKQNWSFSAPNSDIVKIKPSLYNIKLLNNDCITKSNFTLIIEKFFNLKEKDCQKQYANLLKSGEFAIGKYTKDIAETKIDDLNSFVKENSLNFDFFIRKT